LRPINSRRTLGVHEEFILRRNLIKQKSHCVPVTSLLDLIGLCIEVGSDFVANLLFFRLPLFMISLRGNLKVPRIVILSLVQFAGSKTKESQAGLDG